MSTHIRPPAHHRSCLLRTSAWIRPAAPGPATVIANPAPPDTTATSRRHLPFPSPPSYLSAVHADLTSLPPRFISLLPPPPTHIIPPPHRAIYIGRVPRSSVSDIAAGLESTWTHTWPAAALHHHISGNTTPGDDKEQMTTAQKQLSEICVARGVTTLPDARIQLYQ